MRASATPKESAMKKPAYPPLRAEASLLGICAAALVALAALSPVPAQAAEPLVRFDGGIGSQPLRAGPAPNIVRGLSPGGVPWVISELHADVRTDATIRVEGRGLLLGGTDNIGMNGNQSVR